MRYSAPYELPIYVQRFFVERLLAQRNASPHTVASYRDSFRLLLGSFGKPDGAHRRHGGAGLDSCRAISLREAGLNISDGDLQGTCRNDVTA